MERWDHRMRFCVSLSFSYMRACLIPSSRKRYRLRPRSPLASAAAGSVPGVSILRPLKGLDTNLYENLESTFLQEYPDFEIFFCVEDENDQALTVVRELMAKHPAVNAHIAVRTYCLFLYDFLSQTYPRRWPHYWRQPKSEQPHDGVPQDCP